jgi:uncharacterized protein (UPF0332 family)
MRMSFNLWLERDWVKKHKPTSGEIAELLAVADRDLKDSQVSGLSNEARLDMAHNAAVQAAAAALAAAGYRASRQGYHYYVIESLSLTLELEASAVRTLQKLRQKRNISDYERSNVVSRQEAKEMVDLAKDLLRQVKQWIIGNYPELGKDI